MGFHMFSGWFKRVFECQRQLKIARGRGPGDHIFTLYRDHMSGLNSTHDYPGFDQRHFCRQLREN